MIRTAEGFGPVIGFVPGCYFEQAQELMSLQEEQLAVLSDGDLLPRAEAAVTEWEWNKVKDSPFQMPVVYAYPRTTLDHGRYASTWEEGICFVGIDPFAAAYGMQPQACVPVVDVRGETTALHQSNRDYFFTEDVSVVHGLAGAVRQSYAEGRLRDISMNCTRIRDPETFVYNGTPPRLPLGPVIAA